MDVEVEVLHAVNQRDAAAISKLVPQVSSKARSVPVDRIRRVARGQGSCLVVARVAGEVVGMATLLTMVTLVGEFGYVEEVVVDGAVRGHGLGKALMTGLLAAARDRGLDFVELTSRSTRREANGLYRSLGFRLRKTNVYRHDLA